MLKIMNCVLLWLGVCLGPLSFSALYAAQTPSSTSKNDEKNAAPLIQCPVNPNAYNRFALCAMASCWTLDGVAYCKCEVQNEQSTSITFDY
ncbi:hypothetical protein HG263_02420 [Pseudoalteromonas sp. JBTF-M23]|uniref:Uncharacterized protein n=1 Tax=Pseudoalteromonas caenipelagi TaxID=2726988 RepID=A0A849V9E8_9GAMM|nr:hypothetical protein [Pseudoalteromonas caenipelagi]NOU49400.1 hypothetical protein [Pseudoalteromonas caenipelagi]